jgi:uncharacterized protein YehS (DUF1456 family)
MTNNDVLRSLRYILNVNEAKILEIINLTGFKVSKEDLVSFLKQEDAIDYKNCSDKVLGQFLDGLIIYKRGKKENQPAQPLETSLTNNIILKKLRVAFELKDSDIIRLIEKSGIQISKTELTAFFRAKDHRNYRDCGNQFLRNLLKGMAS